MRVEVLAKFSLLSILWGLSFLLVLRVVDGFGWVGAVCIRSFIASSVLLLIALLTRRRLDFSIGITPFAVIGATTVCLQLIGFSIAIPRIGTALTAIIVGAIPLFSALIGKIMKIETITKLGFVGLIIGFFGIVLLVGFPHGQLSNDFFLGIAVSVVGCIAAAFGSNYAKLKMEQVGNWEQAIGAFFFGGLFTLPLLFFVPFQRELIVTDWLYIISLAILCSSLCYVIYFSLVAEVGATRAISVEFMVTVIAVLIGAIYLKELITPIQLLGGVMVLIGCSLILELVGGSKKSAKLIE